MLSWLRRLVGVRRDRFISSDGECSFCAKSFREVGPLVKGPDGRVFICGDCAELCQHIIETERQRRDRSKRANDLGRSQGVRSP